MIFLELRSEFKVSDTDTKIVCDTLRSQGVSTTKFGIPTLNYTRDMLPTRFCARTDASTCAQTITSKVERKTIAKFRSPVKLLFVCRFAFFIKMALFKVTGVILKKDGD